MQTISRIIAIAAVLVAGVSPLPALAQEQAENKGFMAAVGRVTFQRYCASCHGEKADGTGPVAKMLKIPPTDLRQLSIENDGVFPAERVLATIDGREEVRGHGNRDMPVWGEVFQTALVANPATPEEEGEERARRKTRELMYYLETIQLAPDAAEAETTEEDSER